MWCSKIAFFVVLRCLFWFAFAFEFERDQYSPNSFIFSYCLSAEIPPPVDSLEIHQHPTAEIKFALGSTLSSHSCYGNDDNCVVWKYPITYNSVRFKQSVRVNLECSTLHARWTYQIITRLSGKLDIKRENCANRKILNCLGRIINNLRYCRLKFLVETFPRITVQINFVSKKKILKISKTL